MRICFDLDNTLCEGPYESARPLPGVKELLHRLKEEGHTIIIHTARGMNSSNGNIGKVISRLGKLTIDHLDEWDFPYDELVFGKPAADVYVDDKAINAALIHQLEYILRGM